MSITTQAFRIALTAAALCAAGTADARPRRVVVLDFDGPRKLADTGHNSVMSLLGEQYDVVATKKWEAARAAASQKTHGPAQWSAAAKQAGVDAVIEGWVQDEGRRKILNVLVREASNGREFDTISVRLDSSKGLTTDGQKQLAQSLDEVLDWIDAGQNEGNPNPLPPVHPAPLGPTTSASDPEHPVRIRHTTTIDDTTDDDKPTVRKHMPRPVETVDDGASKADETEGADKSATKDKADKTDKAEHEAKAPEVSTADQEKSEIDQLFPLKSRERIDIEGPKVVHTPHKTERFLIDAGGYWGSRSLNVEADADSNVTQFAGVTSKGFQVNAAVYPFPLKPVDGIPSGFGVSASMHHSAGSTVVFDNGDTVEEYVLNQNGYELGVHYRAPLSDMIAIDGQAFYGNQTYEIVDASQDFEVPDTKYSYIGAGGHLDLAITDRASIGVGARYFKVLDAGDLYSTDWYGPGDATGLGLEGSFVIPLPSSLYIRGDLKYQRISIEVTGGGPITDQENVTGLTDSWVSGDVNLGIAF